MLNEDWSRKGFYKTMLRLFRITEEKDGVEKRVKQPVDPPFFLNRQLTEKEFINAQQMYVQGCINEHIERLPTAGKPDSPDRTRWPPGIKDRKIWRVLGYMYFAKTKTKQAEAFSAIKKLAKSGPVKLRPLLKAARLATPQVRRKLDGTDILDLVHYRAKRQFIWNFLRKEAEADSGRLERTEAARFLSKPYQYLNMTEQQIKEGLENPHQADDDTAMKFDISKSTIRPLLHKFYNSVTPPK